MSNEAKAGKPDPADAAKEPKKRKMNIVLLPKLREHDEHEPPVEINPADEIEWLLRQHDGLVQDATFAEARKKAAVTVAANAKARVEQVEDLIQVRLRELVKQHAKGKSKYIDISLDKAGLPDVMKRIQLRAQQPVVTVEDEAKVIDHFTKDALPTDEEAGPCKLIPRHWEVEKGKLNAAAKDNPKIPGVKVEERPDKAYVADPPAKAKKKAEEDSNA